MLSKLFGKKEVLQLGYVTEADKIIMQKSARDRRDEIALRMFQMTVTQQSHEAAADRAVMLADTLIKALDKIEGQ